MLEAFCVQLDRQCIIKQLTLVLIRLRLARIRWKNIAPVMVKILLKVSSDVAEFGLPFPQKKNSLMSLTLADFLNSEERKNLKYVGQMFLQSGYICVQEIV